MTNTPHSDSELDDAIALIKYEIEYADTHGGCPPAVRSIKRHGVAEAKTAVIQWANRRAEKLVVEAVKNAQFKELRAYNIGYDLGWYRAMETVSNDLAEIADAILNSATFKEIEQENGDKPIFLAKILGIIDQLKTMRNEKMPVLLAERNKINEIGKLLSSMPPEAFTNPISFGSPEKLSLKLTAPTEQKVKK